MMARSDQKVLCLDTEISCYCSCDIRRAFPHHSTRYCIILQTAKSTDTCLQTYCSQSRKASVYEISSGSLWYKNPKFVFDDEFSVQNIEFVFRTSLIIALQSPKCRKFITYTFNYTSLHYDIFQITVVHDVYLLISIDV